MSLITIPVGISIFAWTGPTTTLSGATWFNPTNINGIYKTASNKLGYISCKPGALFPGFTDLKPTTPGNIIESYIFNVKAEFQLDDGLIGSLIQAVGSSISDLTINNSGVVSFTLEQGANPGDFDLIISS